MVDAKWSRATADVLALHTVLDYLALERLDALRQGRTGDGSIVTTMLQGRGAVAPSSSASPSRNATLVKVVTRQAFSVIVLQVQKRGSVGRSIDITRYTNYDELRHDLACMFGIQGQLEDPYRMDWKLVYVDHENDILLVGDDPWEEFVSCVKSIKILSSVEVQQMSLDGDLGGIPSSQACSASDDANAWRG